MHFDEFFRKFLVCVSLTVYYLFTVGFARGSIFENYGLSNFLEKLHSAIDSRYSIYMQAYLLRSILQYCCFEKCARGEWNIHLHVYTDRWKLVFCENIISFYSFVSSLVVSAIIKYHYLLNVTLCWYSQSLQERREKCCLYKQVQICESE